MIDHVSIGSRDADRAAAFYAHCFAPLGYTERFRDATQIAFGAGEAWDFWIYPVEAAPVGARSHVAFKAPSREAVQAFHDRAVEQGAQAVRAPGLRPDIDERYFGTVLRDLDGHTIEAVHWQAG